MLQCSRLLFPAFLEECPWQPAFMRTAESMHAM